MLPLLALSFCALFILWLFAMDRKLRPMTSGTLWIPLLWIMVIGSRPVSQWFSPAPTESSQSYIDGNPFDRNVFLFIIVAGVLVLIMRRINWGSIFASNRWVFLFFIYCGISIIWSDYPFVSFKRWTKDIGNIVMALIILTEADPVLALRSVLARFVYFAVPLSVVLIIFFPDIGTYTSKVNLWTTESAVCGVTTNKNVLGGIVFICGLFLIWDFIETRASGLKKARKAYYFGRTVLVSMAIWLIASAHSDTAIICLLLGTGILLFIWFSSRKRLAGRLGTYFLIGGIPILFLFGFNDVLKTFLGVAGRNMTLTGRTELWADLLKMPVNPLIGTGYDSFWLGDRMEHIWRIYSWHPIQAHNGFLETYLNIGLFGVCLLIFVIISAEKKLKKEILNGNSFGVFGFSYLVAALFYNMTEARLDGPELLWFILLMSAMSYRRRAKLAPVAALLAAERKRPSLTPRNLISRY